MRAALAEVSIHANVYVNVSAVVRQGNRKAITDPDFYRPRLDILLDRLGPDRLVFWKQFASS